MKRTGRVRVVHIERTRYRVLVLVGGLSKRTERPTGNATIGACNTPLDKLAGLGTASLGGGVAGETTMRNLDLEEISIK